MPSWRAGFAETDMTPANHESFLCAYGMERYATGRIGPLKVQALALEDARKRRSLIVTGDVSGFERTAVDAMRFRFERDYAVKPQSVMFCASHTHFGPGVQLRMLPYCGVANPWYVARFEKMIHATVGRALEDLSAAQVNYGAADTAIGCNRRLPNKTGRVPLGMRPNPDGHYDRHTPVFHVKRRGRKHDIILVSHACHPTSTGVYDKWSPDYPGHMRDEIEKQTGAKGMFAQGCGGDAKVCKVDRKNGETVFVADKAGCRRAGLALAKTALAIVNGGDMIALPAQLVCREKAGFLKIAKAETEAELRRIATEGDLNSYYTWTARQLLEFPGGNRDRVPYRVQSFTFGKTLTLLGLEGEVCSPLAPMARAIPKTKHTAVFGYCNDTLCYIPTRRILWEGGYEADHRTGGLRGPFTSTIDSDIKRMVRQSLETHR
jgi:hypothetical protein